jgi:hypothetical protein
VRISAGSNIQVTGCSDTAFNTGTLGTLSQSVVATPDYPNQQLGYYISTSGTGSSTGCTVKGASDDRFETELVQCSNGTANPGYSCGAGQITFVNAHTYASTDQWGEVAMESPFNDGAGGTGLVMKRILVQGSAGAEFFSDESIHETFEDDGFIAFGTPTSIPFEADYPQNLTVHSSAFNSVNNGYSTCQSGNCGNVSYPFGFRCTMIPPSISSYQAGTCNNSKIDTYSQVRGGIKVDTNGFSLNFGIEAAAPELDRVLIEEPVWGGITFDTRDGVTGPVYIKDSYLQDFVSGSTDQAFIAAENPGGTGYIFENNTYSENPFLVNKYWYSPAISVRGNISDQLYTPWPYQGIGAVGLFEDNGFLKGEVEAPAFTGFESLPFGSLAVNQSPASWTSACSTNCTVTTVQDPTGGQNGANIASNSTTHQTILISIQSVSTYPGDQFIFMDWLRPGTGQLIPNDWRGNYPFQLQTLGTDTFQNNGCESGIGSNTACATNYGLPMLNDDWAPYVATATIGTGESAAHFMEFNLESGQCTNGSILNCGTQHFCPQWAFVPGPNNPSYTGVSTFDVQIARMYNYHGCAPGGLLAGQVATNQTVVAAQIIDSGTPSSTAPLCPNGPNGQFTTSGCVAGAVTSVSNSDGTLTIFPTTSAVVASLNTSHANSWTGLQTFGTDISIGGVTATGATGTGNVVFSAAPTFTGTITGVNLTLTGIESGSGSSCLQISTAGVISNTGAPCGSGSGAVNSITGDGGIITNSLSTGAVTLTLGATEAGQFIVASGSGTAVWGKQVTLGHQNDSGALANGSLTIAGSTTASGNLTLNGTGSSPGQMSLFLNSAGTIMDLGSTNATVSAAGAYVGTNVTDSALNVAGLVTNSSAGLLGTEANCTIAQGCTNATSATAGTVPNATSGTASSWTPTPALGTDNSVSGTLQLSNNTANAHSILGSAATTSNTVKLFATTPTNLDLIYCASSGGVCTLTDAGYAYNSIPLADIASQSANIIVGTTTSGSPVALSAPSCSGATNALIWTTGTGFGCNTITTSSVAFSGLTSSTNTTAAMVVGTGASLSTSGSGTIVATSSPFSGLTTSTNTTATMTVGTGATITYSGSAVINSTAVESAGAITTNATYYFPIISSSSSGNYELNAVAGLTINPSTGSMDVPSGIATGGLSNTISGGTAGFYGPIEGTAPTAITGSGNFDIIYADSTLHADMECPESNSTAVTTCLPVALMPATSTAGDVVYSTNSNGYNLSDAGYPYNAIPNADLAHSAITIAGTSVSLGGSTTSLPSPGVIGGTTPAAATFTALTANTSLVINGGTAQTGTQGTDTKLLTAGTISGTSILLCTDANGGATTTSCPSGGSGVVSAAAQYDIAYYTQSGTTAQVGGAAISGFQFDSTSGAPAAATAAQLGTLAAIATGDLVYSGGTSSALQGSADFTISSHTLTGGSNAIFDMSAGVNVKLPVTASYTSAANGEQGYDSTNKNWHIWGNAVDNFNVIVPVSTSITNGHCSQWSLSGGVLTLIDAGSTCGSDSGGGISGWSGTPLTFISSTTQYAPPVGGGLTATSESTADVAAPAAETISSLAVSLSAALGAGATLQVTFRDNGASTALTCTTASGGTSCTDTTHSVNIAKGDLIDLLLVSSGTVTAGVPQIIANYAVGTSGVGVTSIATTGPITGGTITSTGTIACATCVTSAASLTANGIVIGAGSQGAQTLALVANAVLSTNSIGVPSESTTLPIALTIPDAASIQAQTVLPLTQVGIYNTAALPVTTTNPALTSYTVSKNRRACVIDNDTQSATALTAAQFSGKCVIPFAATIVEVDVSGGTQTLNGTATAPTYTGTSSIQIGKSGAQNVTGILSGVLATASGRACAVAGTSGTCIFDNGMTSSTTVQLSDTSVAAGDQLYISAATADATQTWYDVTIVYTVN